MSIRKKSSNKKVSDEECTSDSDYITTVLSYLNGYCKVNLVVPQTSLFCTSDSLLPINAKVNDIKLNNKINTNQIGNTSDNLADMLKNVVNLKNDENVNDKELQATDKGLVDEFKTYSKPSYHISDYSNYPGRKEEKKRSVSPKGKKKKNKCNKADLSSMSENQTPSSSIINTELVSSTDYFNQFGNNKLDEREKSTREQDLQKKQMKNNTNNIHMSRSSKNRYTELESPKDNTPTQSQCPLCFGLYPTPDIEAHASECRL